MKILSCMLLAVCLAAGEADPLAGALQLEDGDAFATDRMEQAISATPVGKRKPLIERLAAADRDDVEIVLHRMIQDEDTTAAAAAIDALAKRWPTRLQDAELIRTLIPRPGPAADAACRFAAAINDDEALQALVDRAAARTDDQPSEQALRKLLSLPGGCGPEGWGEALSSVQKRNATALEKAELLLEGSPMDAIAAITLVAGMRPIGTRATMVLLRAAEHPDHTVRNSAISILSTCTSPPAVAWNKQLRQEREAAKTDAEVATAGTSPGAETAPPPQPAPQPASVPVAAPAEAASNTWLIWLLVGLGAVAGLIYWRTRGAKPLPTPGSDGDKHITWTR